MFRSSIRKSAENWIESHLLIPAVFSFLAGLILSEGISFGHGLIAAAVVGPAVLLSLALLLPFRRIWVLFAFLVLGLSRGLTSWHGRVEPTHWLFQSSHGPRSHEATVIGPLSGNEGVFRAGVELEGKERGKLLLSFSDPAFPIPFATGDRIHFFGRIKTPARYRNPGSFDYVTFLRRRGIEGVVHLDSPALVLKEGSPSRWNPAGWIDRARMFLDRRLAGVVPPLHRGWIETILINWRLDLDRNVFRIFQRPGQAHLLSISGLHIVFFFFLVFVPLRWILSFVDRWLVLGWHTKIATGGATLAAAFYAALAGGDYPALRGAIFVLAGLAALFLARPRRLPEIFFGSVFLIVLWAPSAPWEASFQLSFAAIGGITLVLPLIRSFPRKGLLKGLWSAVVMTGAASAATLPIVLHHFGEWSLISLVAAPLLIPLFGFLIFPMAVVWLFLSLIHTGVAVGYGEWIGPLLDFFLWLLKWFGEIGVPITVWWRPDVFWSLIMFLGFTLAALAFFLPQVIVWRRFWRWVLSVAAAALLILPYPLSTRRPDQLSATFLDVSQGDAAVLEFPSGATVLIDAGAIYYGAPSKVPRQAFDFGERVIIPYLQSRALRKIDLMVLSHPHPDHYGGMASVAGRIPVGRIWFNADSLHAPYLQHLRDLAVRRGTILEKVAAGQGYSFGEGRLEVLWPPLEERGPGIQSVNDRSVVVRASYGKSSLLLTGDIEREAEAVLSRSGSVTVHLLKAPHHGSRSSNSPVFLDSVAPRVAVVSCGSGNRFGFPHEEVLERYRQRGVLCLRTDREGAIRLVTADGSWRRAAVSGLPN